MRKLIFLIIIASVVSRKRSDVAAPNIPKQKMSKIVVQITTSDSIQYEVYPLIQPPINPLGTQSIVLKTTQLTFSWPLQADSAQAEVMWVPTNPYKQDTVRVTIYDNNKLVYSGKSISNSLGSYFNWK